MAVTSSHLCDRPPTLPPSECLDPPPTAAPPLCLSTPTPTTASLALHCCCWWALRRSQTAICPPPAPRTCRLGMGNTRAFHGFHHGAHAWRPARRCQKLPLVAHGKLSSDIRLRKEGPCALPGTQTCGKHELDARCGDPRKQWAHHRPEGLPGWQAAPRSQHNVAATAWEPLARTCQGRV